MALGKLFQVGVVKQLGLAFIVNLIEFHAVSGLPCKNTTEGNAEATCFCFDCLYSVMNFRFKGLKI
jgi:hypothetical protein